MSTSETIQQKTREQYRDSSNLDARIRLHRLFSTNTYGWYRWVFDRFILPENARILELGCGTASLWIDQAGRIEPGWQVTLTDYSAGMVNKARAGIGNAGLGKQFSFAVLDAQVIPFPTAAFDAVVANHMLYHVPDRRRAIGEARRVLKPGGRFIAATNGNNHIIEIENVIARYAPTIDRVAGLHSQRVFNRSFSLETGMEQIAAWFKTVVLEAYEDGLEVTEAQPLVDYVLSLAPQEKRASAEGIQELAEAVEAEIQARGAFHMTKDSGVFVAQ